MSELWFTSDQHFGHARILEYCTGRAKLWSTVAEMNEGLIARHNAVVKPSDTVIHLGDIAMGKRQDTVPLVRRLNGTHTLVPGNHDNCWNQGRDGSGTTPHKCLKHCADYHEWGFDRIWQPPVSAPMFHAFDDQRIILSHLPPLECGDHKDGEVVYENEIRFAAQRPTYPPLGTWMLCGHVHEAWRTHGRVINVGVDVWDYAPVHVSTLLASIQQGEGA